MARICNATRRQNLYRSVLFALSLCGVLVATAEESREIPEASPVNPRFVQWLKAREEGGKPRKLAAESGGVPRRTFVEIPPEPLDYSYLLELRRAARQENVRSLAQVVLPSSYDSRSVGCLTPVKDQGRYGTCWAHASIGALETILKKTTGATYDFSENNLTTRHLFNFKSEKGRFDNGGHTAWAQAYYLGWEGPVHESQDPYPNPSVVKVLPAVKHVQQVLYIPARTGSLDNSLIKQAIKTYGSMPIYYRHEDFAYNSRAHAYYYNGSDGINHAVLAVGWNDDYPRTNFSTPPPGNGAFLIRNSWGSGWGDGGYCWISYYDTRVGEEASYAHRVFTAVENDTNYERLYQYDPLGRINDWGFSSETAWGANIFVAKTCEKVRAVGFYANAPSTRYEIFVYRDCLAGNPTSGDLVGTASGTTDRDYSGYFTVKVDSTGSIRQGSRFSIVLKLTTPGYNYPLAREYAWSGYSDKATANPGESFIRSASGTTWRDMTASDASANFCAKAYTDTGDQDDNRPANDDFASARPISGATGTDSVSNAGATSETGEPSHGMASSTNSIWWRWTAPTSGTVAFTTEGSDFDTGLAAYSGSRLSSLTKLKENDDARSGVRWSSVSFSVTAGTTYRIAVGGYRAASGTVKLNWTMTTAAAMLSSISLAGAATVNENEKATYSCKAHFSDGTSKSVTPRWALLGAPASCSISSAGVLTVGVLGADVSTSVEASYSEGGITRTETLFVTLKKRNVRPSNDDFAQPMAISGTSGSASASSVGATHEPGEGSHGIASATNSIWFSWTAPCSAVVTFTTRQSDFDTGLAVYTGSSLYSLSTVVQNDDANLSEYVTWSMVPFAATAGVRYRIAVAGWKGRTGSVVLNWQVESAQISSLAISGPSSVSAALPQQYSCVATMSDGSTKSVNPTWSLVGSPTCATISNAGLLTARPVTANQDVTVAASYEENGVRKTAAKPVTVLASSSGPSNDAFANAAVISGSQGSASGTNVGATQEQGEPRHAELGAVNSVWWRWRAPANARVTFTTEGSGFDTGLSVYVGEAVGALSLVAENGDADAANSVRWSRVSFTASVGCDYRIAVAGYNGREGSICLNWSSDAAAGLEHFTIEDGVLTAWDEVGTTDVVLPDDAGIREIAPEAFYLTKLTSIVLPHGLKVIGDRSFGICGSLTNVVFNDDLEIVDDWAFDLSRKLCGYLRLPDSVVRIGKYAFWGTAYETASLPGNLEKIGAKAFYQCPALTAVYFRGNAPRLLGETYSTTPCIFTETPEDLVVYVPEGSTGWGGVGSALPDRWPTVDGADARHIEFNRSYVLRFVDRGRIMQEMPVSGNKVVKLPVLPLSNPGKRFAGWACSNGRRYDDGMLVFNLAQPGMTVTMTAIWE